MEPVIVVGTTLLVVFSIVLKYINIYLYNHLITSKLQQHDISTPTGP
jgi:hypothetical protein